MSVPLPVVAPLLSGHVINICGMNRQRKKAGIKTADRTPQAVLPYLQETELMDHQVLVRWLSY